MSAGLPDPPPIEHITQNYVPLKSIILAVSERSGKELANILRTTENLPNDTARKEQFLKFVVACRQEYVKLYVLCKWAVVSQEISRSIDVSNWLHGQVNCFNNVVGALFQLQSGLGSAKSPWADLDSALQVLSTGYPLPPLEVQMRMKKPSLSDLQVLELLKRLDVLIALRLALHEQLPVHYRNYEVRNGRARFFIGNHTLWVDFSIADEDVAKSCRFFYVDCGFQNNETMDANLKMKLEVAINQQLSQRSLLEVLNWISYVVAIYKLQYLDRQFSQLETGAGPWASVILHRFSSNSIQVRYFLDTMDPGEITLTLDTTAPYSLIIEPSLDINLNGSLENLAHQILELVTKNHAINLINTIRAPWISKKSELSLSVELTPYRFTELSIDSTSGKIALAGQSSLIRTAQQKLNEGHNALLVLSELRTRAYMETLATRAEATNWHTQRCVNLPPDELAKIAPHTYLLALRLSNYADWSLCIAMGSTSDGHALEPRWFAARLKSEQRRWTLHSINDVQKTLNVEDPDYRVFVELSKIYEKQFALLDIMSKLESANIKHALKRKNGLYVGIVLDFTTIIAESSLWAYSGLMLTFELGKLSIEGRSLKNKLSLLGNISENLESGTLSIRGDQGVFVISTSQSSNQLTALIESLKQLHYTATCIVTAESMNVKILSVTLSRLVIKYAEPQGVLYVDSGRKIALAESNPQWMLAPFLSTISEHSHSSLDQTVTFLKQFYPVWEIINKVQSKRPEWGLIMLPQSMNQIRIRAGFSIDDPHIDISLKDFRRIKCVYFVSADESAAKIETIARLFTKISQPGVVPLIGGCAVDIESAQVIESILEALGTNKNINHP